MMRTPLLLLLIAVSFAAEESSFALWTPVAIQQRKEALMKSVKPVSVLVTPNGDIFVGEGHSPTYRKLR